MPRKRSRPTGNILSQKTASVSISRNGLVLEVQNVLATDAAIVAAALLDAVRELVKAGYDELIVEAGGLHSGALGEMPDEDGVETYTEPAQLPVKRVGFTTA